MKSKIPFILTLIGIILGFFGSIFGIIHYLLFKTINQEFDNFFSSFGFNFELLLKFNLITSIIGIIICFILIFYIKKLKKNPTKTDYIIITFLGGFGIILGMGIGGILILIGGIIGIIKNN
ncbi:MAG: hypothetical protein ACLFPJ_04125 [Candidatus Woesearchaeota archaeon]